MPFTRTLFLCALCLLTFNSAQAEEVKQLKKVHVIGTTDKYKAEALKDTPLRTEIISREELEKTHAKTLDGALRYTPGISLKPIGGDTENGVGISIQGLDPDQVLIMIDGNPVAPNSGAMINTVDISQILIGNAERIEIIKGGASAIYGANAMGGVVNIITRTPGKPFDFSVDLSAGNWGEVGAEVPIAKDTSTWQASTKLGKFSAQLIADFVNQKGYDTLIDSVETDGWHGYKNNYSGKLQYDFTPDARLTISPSFYRAQTATYRISHNIYTPFEENNTIRDRDTWNATFSGKGFSDLGYKLNYMNQVQKEYLDGTSKVIDQESKNESFDLSLSQSFGEDHLVGLTLKHNKEFLRQDRIEKKTQPGKDPITPLVDNKSKYYTDIAANHSWFITDSFESVLALRFNNDEFYGNNLSPMLSTMYSNSNWINGKVNIRASISDGYRTPTLKEMYWFFDHSSIAVLGNDQLEPEKSLNTSLSFEFLTNNNSRYEIALFHNEIENEIKEVSNSEKRDELNEQGYSFADVAVFENTGKARTRGFDLSYESKFKYASINATYSYLDAIILATGKTQVQKPKDQLQLGVDFFNASSSARLSVMYRFTSKQYLNTENTKYVDNFSILDMKFNHDLTKNFTWYAGINNLLDAEPEKYTSSGAHSSSGNSVVANEPRYVYLGIRYQL